ncbi:PTS transporter subunit EIIB, partial [Candidatus Symbiopectobacterium sp. NZEC135]|uniref:PTS transporter subunit EIIB n=1 Tax=Candidatus Symbiopectobacterium sp. NZEC135 TaxID=2820471 RepID=UPI002227F394
MAKITLSMVEEILYLIGGRENVILCGNCMTRLRLTLKDRQLIALDALKKIPGVLGVVNGDDQLQVILGPGKAQTASEMMNALLVEPAQSVSTGEEPPDLRQLASQNKQHIKAKQKSAVHNFLTKFATIFTPLIPGFIAAGLLLGIATLLQQTLVVEGVAQAAWLKSLIAYMKVFSIG